MEERRRNEWSSIKKGGALLPGLVKERHKIYAERLAAMQKPAALEAPTRVTNSNTHGHYDGAELRPFDGRPGAMRAYELPSRGIGA